MTGACFGCQSADRNGAEKVQKHTTTIALKQDRIMISHLKAGTTRCQKSIARTAESIPIRQSTRAVARDSRTAYWPLAMSDKRDPAHRPEQIHERRPREPLESGRFESPQASPAR